MTEYGTSGPNEAPTWEPYEHNFLSQWVKLRWKGRYIFQRRPLPFTSLTAGEMLLFAALAAFAVLSSIGGGTSMATGLLALSFATAIHNSPLTYLLGIPFERAITWHKVITYLSVVAGGLHGFNEDEGGSRALSGYIMWGAMCGLVVFSLWPIRRLLFEFFYRFHWILFLIVIGAGIVHGASSLMGGAAFWIADVLFRYIYQASLKNPKEAQITALPSDVIRISFDKGDFKYHAGQYVFLCVPALSLFEWHPFSLSSYPGEDKVSMHIRVLGNWTRNLYTFSDKLTESKNIKVYIEGPYGEPAVDIEGDRYKTFMLISGGIGITPMQSICNELTYQVSRGRKLKKVWFVWSVRDKYMIDSVADIESNPRVSQRLPYSFTPDLLKDMDTTDLLSDESHLLTEFFLTKVRDEKMLKDANISPSSQAYLRFGRPCLGEMFKKMGEFMLKNDEKRCAVLVCGPPSMVNETMSLCWKMSQRDISFDYHGEVFEF